MTGLRGGIMQKESAPYVSIAVCIYNGAKTLEVTIESLLKQSYPKDMYEIILLDDGSTDRSPEICAYFMEESKNELPLITYVQQKNSGLTAARNTSVSISKGQIIAFIDQDAMATKDWILHIANKFQTSPLPKIVGGPVLLLNKDSKFASLMYDSFFSDYMKDKHTVIGTNMAFSRSLLMDEKPFHPSLIHRGDETYIFHKLKAKVTPEQIPRAAVYHETPASIKAWLKTRYEGGYVGAFLAILNGKHVNDKKNLTMMIINKLLFLILPVIIILSPILKLDILLHLAVISYLLLTFRRYFATGYVKGLLKHFWHTRKANTMDKLYLVPIISFLLILGYYYEDFGYIRKMISHLTSNDYDKSDIFKEPEVMKKLNNIKC